MHVVILSSRAGWQITELTRALHERGHSSIVLPYESLVARLGTRRDSGAISVSPAHIERARDSFASADQPARSPSLDAADAPALLDADAVLPRIIPHGSLEQIIFRVDALHWLEDRGVTVMNSPRAIERAVDKFYTTALLQEAGLPTPATVVCEGAAEAMDAIAHLGDVVIKPLFGSMGHGLVRVKERDVAWRVVRALEEIRAVFYVQEVIDHRGRDIRAFVIGGAVVAAIERRAAAGEWRTNVSRGGSAHPVTLSAEWTELAVRAAAAIGADYAGVDLLPTGGGGDAYVLEVNAIPGWQGLQEATGVDIASAIVDHLAARHLRSSAPVLRSTATV